MDVLWLTESQANTLFKVASDDAPHETCGIIAGKGYKAHQIIPVKNIADDSRHFFTLDPIAMASILPELDDHGLEILAYYHSHPRGKPIPSETDIANADYGSVHLIIGLGEKKPELAVWEFHDLRVTRVELCVGIMQPGKPIPPVSRAQHHAILITTLIAVVIMLIISLTLLPPAPPLP
ncbi:MAG: M67 family metallopeptidase [Aggregatilineales bacterium]